MERKIGLSSRRALSKASSPHGYQSTGLWACWSKYGLFSLIKRLVYCPSCVIPAFSFFCWVLFLIKARVPPPSNKIPRRPVIKAFLLCLACIRLIRLMKDKDISLSVEAPFLARAEFITLFSANRFCRRLAISRRRVLCVSRHSLGARDSSIQSWPRPLFPSG